MIWQQFREEWVRLNACKFCEGFHMHTCSLYQCKPAIEKAGQYFETVIAQEEMRTMKRKYVTDLRPWFTESLKMRNIVIGKRGRGKWVRKPHGYDAVAGMAKRGRGDHQRRYSS